MEFLLEDISNSNIKIKLENNLWVATRPYQYNAFKEFKKINRHRQIPYIYNNNDIKFSIQRINNDNHGGIILIKESGSISPIADWDNVKVFLINNRNENNELLPTNWYNAYNYQTWAYFDYIYNRYECNDITYVSIGTQFETTLSIIILPENLNLESNIIFTISKNDNDTISYQKYNDNIKIRISDNDYSRNGYLGFYRRITSDVGLILNTEPISHPKLCIPKNIIICTTNDENKMCIVCNNNEQNIQFVPCNHTIMCSECYLQYNKSYECIVCRQQIESINKYNIL